MSRFVYGTRPNVPKYPVKGGVTYRLVTAHMGSVRLVPHSATGEVAQRIASDAFGRVTRDTRPGFQPFDYAGGVYDAATGLVRFGARDYDAETGRWTAKDPPGFAAGDANLYSYVGNDPTNANDPSGRICPPCAAFAWAAGRGAAAGMATDVAFQFAENGGTFDCFDWDRFFRAGAVGAASGIGAKAVGAAAKTWKARQAAKGVGKQVDQPKPRPHDWNDRWEYREREAHGTARSDKRYFDEKGGEWRWQDADRRHPDGHWDYNPHDTWNSGWKNLPWP